MFTISAECNPDTLERSVELNVVKVDYETKGIIECKKTLRPEFTEQELLDVINEAIARIDNTIALLKLRSNYENN